VLGVFDGITARIDDHGGGRRFCTIVCVVMAAHNLVAVCFMRFWPETISTLLIDIQSIVLETEIE